MVGGLAGEGAAKEATYCKKLYEHMLTFKKPISLI